MRWATRRRRPSQSGRPASPPPVRGATCCFGPSTAPLQEAERSRCLRRGVLVVGVVAFVGVVADDEVDVVGGGGGG